MKVKLIDLNSKPKLRATLIQALKTQRKRAATRAKDYLLAEALRVQFRRSTKHPSLLSTEGDGVYIAACAIAKALQRDNPRFNRKHFLAVVCGQKDLHAAKSR
jgi:hypothetical protein